MNSDRSNEVEEVANGPIIEIDWEGDPKDLKVFHPLTGKVLFCGEHEFDFDDYRKIEGVLFVYSAAEGDLIFATEEIAEVCYGFEEFSSATLGTDPMAKAEIEIAMAAANHMANNPVFFHITTYYMAHVPEPDIVLVGLDLTPKNGND